MQDCGNPQSLARRTRCDDMDYWWLLDGLQASLQYQLKYLEQITSQKTNHSSIVYRHLLELWWLFCCCKQALSRMLGVSNSCSPTPTLERKYGHLSLASTAGSTNNMQCMQAMQGRIIFEWMPCDNKAQLKRSMVFIYLI